MLRLATVRACRAQTGVKVAITVVAVAVSAVVGCVTPPPPPPRPSQLSPAVAQARSSLPVFWTALWSSTSATAVFGVLLDGPGGACVGDVDERAVWLETVQRRGDVVSGIVDSASVGGGGGRVVSGDIDDVCDWVIADGDVIEGAFTLRQKRAGMSAEEQAAFDQSVGGHFGTLGTRSPWRRQRAPQTPRPRRPGDLRGLDGVVRRLRVRSCRRR